MSSSPLVFDLNLTNSTTVVIYFNATTASDFNIISEANMSDGVSSYSIPLRQEVLFNTLEFSQVSPQNGSSTDSLSPVFSCLVNATSVMDNSISNVTVYIYNSTFDLIGQNSSTFSQDIVHANLSFTLPVNNTRYYYNCSGIDAWNDQTNSTSTTFLAGSPVTTCTSCGDCDSKLEVVQPGYTIQLANNIVSTTDCIQVDDTYGATLDCNGFQIRGDHSGTGDYGLRLRYGNNLKVRNCEISGFQGYGFYVEEIVNFTALDNHVYNGSIEDNGFFIRESENIVMRNNNFSNRTFAFGQFLNKYPDVDQSNIVDDLYTINMSYRLGNMTIDGADHATVGYLSCEECYNVTIQNFDIASRVSEVISMNNGTDNRIENVNTSLGNFGVYSAYETNLTVDGATVTKNLYGLMVDTVSQANLRHIYGNNNSVLGILLYLSTETTLEDAVANFNGDHGVYMESNYLRLHNISTAYNNQYGIYVFYNYAVIDNVTGEYNGYSVMQVDGNYNNISNVTSRYNNLSGMYVPGDRNIITNVLSYQNAYYNPARGEGISIYGAYNIFDRFEVYQTGGAQGGIGFNFQGGDYNNLTNSISYNSNNSLRIGSNANYNIISNVSMNATTEETIRIYISSQNTLRDNYIEGRNYTINYFGTSNAYDNYIFNNHIHKIGLGNGINLSGSSPDHTYNTSYYPSTNILGGPYMGGNYWTNSSGTGYSETCTDSDFDLICDTQFSPVGSLIDYYPLTADIDPPAPSAPWTSDSTPDSGSSVTFNITWYDLYNLSQAVFYWNYTGTWESNGTYSLSEKQHNLSISRIVTGDGLEVYYMWNATDNAGNKNQSLSSSFIVQSFNPCSTTDGSDITISTVVSCNDTAIHYGDVTIESGGALLLDNVTLRTDRFTINSGAGFRMTNAKNSLWVNGNWTISGSVNISNSTVRMNGTKDTSVILNVTPTGSLIINETSNITNGENVTAHYFFMVANGAEYIMERSYVSETGSSPTGVGYFVLTTPVRFDDNLLYNVSGGILFNGSYTNATNLTVYSNGNAIWLGIGQGVVDHINISGCNLDSNNAGGSQGVTDASYGGYNFIEGCAISRAATGLHLNSNNNKVYNTMIVNGTSLMTAGISLWGANYSYFEGVNVSGATYGIRLLGTDQNSTFTNNRVWNSTSGIYFSNLGGKYPIGNLFYDNMFNTSTAIQYSGSISTANYFNTTLDCTTTNIMGGKCTGGNFYANDSTGYSETCTDVLAPYGICDNYLNMTQTGDAAHIDYYPLAADSCNPPPTGQWTVSGTEVCYDRTITLDGDLRVSAGTGNLIFDNVTLIMDCASDLEHDIRISGTWIVNHSNITVSNPNFESNLKAEVGSTVHLERSYISEMGNAFGINTAGIELHEDATIIHNIIRNNYEGIFIYGGASSHNNQIINNTIINSGRDGINLYQSDNNNIAGNTITTAVNVGIYAFYSDNNELQNNTATGAIYGFYDEFTNNNVYRNNSAGGNPRGIHAQHGSNIELYNNHFYNSAAEGMWIYNMSGSTLMHNNASKNAGSNIVVALNSGHVVVNNTASNSTGNIGIEIDYTNNTVVANNTVQGNDDYGIYLTNAWWVNVTGNNITDHTDSFGILVVTNAENNMIEDNILYNDLYGIYAAFADNNIYRNNNLSSMLIALEAQDSDNISMFNNSVNTAQQGMRFRRADDGLIVQNKIYGATVRSVWLYNSSRNIMEYNLLNVSLKDLIGVEGHLSTNNVIRNNTLDNGQAYLINLTRVSGTNITGNFMQNTNGILWNNLSNSTHFISNTAVHASQGVYNFEANNLYIRNNSITDVANQGIVINGGSHDSYIDFNTIRNTTTGIFIESSRNITASNNSIYDDQSRAIQAQYSTNLNIAQNFINDTANYGAVIMLVENSTASDNIFNNSVYDAFILSDAKNVTVRGNEFRNAGYSGLRVTDATGTNYIYDNLAYQNTRNGIYLNFSDAQVLSGNNLTDNTQQGINVSSSHNVNITSTFGYSNTRRGIMIGSSNNVIIDNVTLDFNEISISSHNSNNTRVEDSRAYSPEGGINIEMRYGARDMVVYNTTTIGADTGPEIYMNSVRGIKVLNSTIGNSTSIWGFYATSGENIELRNNTFGAVQTVAISILYGGNVTIQGSTLSGSTSHGIAIVNATNTTIQSNVISSAGGDGIIINSQDRHTIEQNTITSSGIRGIEIGYGHGANIFNNTLSGSASQEILLLRVNASNVTNNYISPFAYGIYALNITNTNVVANIITGGAQDSITIKDANRTNLFSNIIISAGMDAIELNNAPNITIYLNQINNTGLNAILVLNDSDDVSIGYNSINKTGNYGVYVNESLFGIYVGNSILYTNSEAIHLHISSGSSTIMYNTVGYASYGIRVLSDDVNITSNKVLNTTSNRGIFSQNNNNVRIYWNNVTYAASQGISTYAATNNNIVANIVLQSGKDGINVYNQSNNSLIYNNNVASNVRSGLNVTSSHHENISNNIFVHNSLHGIYLNKSTFTVLESNNISNNTNTGLYLQKADNSYLWDNDVYFNTQFGLNLLGSNNLTLESNTFISRKDSAVIQQGLYIVPSNGVSDLVHDIDDTNTLNGNPIMYFDSNYKACPTTLDFEGKKQHLAPPAC